MKVGFEGIKTIKACFRYVSGMLQAGRQCSESLNSKTISDGEVKTIGFNVESLMETSAKIKA